MNSNDIFLIRFINLVKLGGFGESIRPCRFIDCYDYLYFWIYIFILGKVVFTSLLALHSEYDFL